MKITKLSLFSLFVVSTLMFAQTVADYYPMNVGNYWIQHSDSMNGVFNPTTFRTDIEDTDLIGAETYFRMSQIQSADDGSSYSQWFLWMREDPTGCVISALGTSDSVTIFDTPIPNFPNDALNLGYSWEYDFPVKGVGIHHWKCLTESISETVEVPAGIFNDCKKIKSIITDESGDTIQTLNLYYAKGIGQVLNEGWSWYGGKYNFELTEYSTQTSIDEEEGVVLPNSYTLFQNYPNPFNPSTLIKYGIPEQSIIEIEIFNVLGQSVGILVNEEKSTGFYETTWNAENLPSGIYLICIRAEELSSNKTFTHVKKALLLK